MRKFLVLKSFALCFKFDKKNWKRNILNCKRKRVPYKYRERLDRFFASLRQLRPEVSITSWQMSSLVCLEPPEAINESLLRSITLRPHTKTSTLTHTYATESPTTRSPRFFHKCFYKYPLQQQFLIFLIYIIQLNTLNEISQISIFFVDVTCRRKSVIVRIYEDERQRESTVTFRNLDDDLVIIYTKSRNMWHITIRYHIHY